MERRSAVGIAAYISLLIYLPSFVGFSLDQNRLKNCQIDWIMAKKISNRLGFFANDYNRLTNLSQRLKSIKID